MPYALAPISKRGYKISVMPALSMKQPRNKTTADTKTKKTYGLVLIPWRNSTNGGPAFNLATTMPKVRAMAIIHIRGPVSLTVFKVDSLRPCKLSFL